MIYDNNLNTIKIFTVFYNVFLFIDISQFVHRIFFCIASNRFVSPRNSIVFLKFPCLLTRFLFREISSFQTFAIPLRSIFSCGQCIGPNGFLSFSKMYPCVSRTYQIPCLFVHVSSLFVSYCNFFFCLFIRSPIDCGFVSFTGNAIFFLLANATPFLTYTLLRFLYRLQSSPLIVTLCTVPIVSTHSRRAFVFLNIITYVFISI